jgi:hypothetical protein
VLVHRGLGVVADLGATHDRDLDHARHRQRAGPATASMIFCVCSAARG